MQQAFVVLRRPPGQRSLFDMYVAMVETKEAAIRAVQAACGAEGDYEINGKPLSVDTAQALRLEPGEVRKL